MSPAMTTTATNGGVTFSLFNDDGTTNVYLRTTNTLTLLIENNFSSALRFAGDGSSHLLLDFSGLVSAATLASVASPSGWATSVDESRLKLHPPGPVTIGAGRTLIITIGGVTVSHAPTIANVHLDLVLSTTNITTCSTAMAVLNAPSADAPPLPLSIALSAGQVVLASGTQPFANAFNVNFVSQATSTITAGTDTAILLSFVYGSGAGDLTTSTLGADIGVSILQQPTGNSTNWTPSSLTYNSMPVWQLTSGSPNAFGTQANGILVAALHNVTTNSTVGVTDVYVAYTGVPNYSDASFRLPLQKVPQIGISSFTASSTSVDGTTLPANVTLSYTVANATYVTIVNAGYSKNVISPYTDSTTVSIDGATTFTLIATNATTGQTASQSVAVTTTVSPYDALPAGSIVMWSGTTAPEGWQICDGSTLNGYTTPNLVAQFIQGADPTGTNASVGQSGGPDTHVHVFSASLAGTTSQAGQHQHTVQITNLGTGCSIGLSSSFFPLITKSNNNNNPAFPTSWSGLHSHSVTVTGSGTTSTQSSGSLMRPAWYALYFIMKCY